MYFDGTNRRELYLQTASQLYFTYQLGDKPQFVAPAWYKPAGGGIWGQAGDQGSFFNNGMPTQEAILLIGAFAE